MELVEFDGAIFMRRWSILLIRTMVKIISAEEFVNDERNNVKSITREARMINVQ